MWFLRVWIERWKERRRAKWQKELAFLDRQIATLTKEIEHGERLNNSIHDSAVDYGSEFELDRHDHRRQIISYDRELLAKDERRREKLLGFLGLTDKKEMCHG